jgi:DHA1 family bicyclomycin/chloramphenicol resistance-like MFS transporter
MFLATVVFGELTVAAAVGWPFLFTVSVGMVSPASLTKALSVNPKTIGSASGLYGFMQMVIGAICTSLSGLGGNPALAAALILAAAGIMTQIAFWIALRHEKAGKFSLKT